MIKIATSNGPKNATWRVTGQNKCLNSKRSLSGSKTIIRCVYGLSSSTTLTASWSLPYMTLAIRSTAQLEWRLLLLKKLHQSVPAVARRNAIRSRASRFITWRPSYLRSTTTNVRSACSWLHTTWTPAKKLSEATVWVTSRDLLPASVSLLCKETLSDGQVCRGPFSR